MNLILNCNISLSKKLRSICGDEVTLVLRNIHDGKGHGMLITNVKNDLDHDQGEEAKKIIESETSIMLTPKKIEYEQTSYDAVPNLFSDQGSYLDSVDATISKTKKTNPLKKFMEVVPSKKEGRNNHFDTEGHIPEEFEDLKDPKLMDHIQSVQELWEEIDRTRQTKTSKIDLDAIQNPRLKAEAEETINVEEGLDKQVYVVNETSGSIRLNDIGLTFDKNVPVDLSRVSAKRLHRSNDLRVLFKENLLKLISPEERAHYLGLQGKNIEFGLDTYGKVDEAIENFGREPRNTRGPRSEESFEFDVGEDDDDYQTDAESILAQREKQKPRSSVSSQTLAGGVRKTSHGSKKRSTQDTQEDSSRTYYARDEDMPLKNNEEIKKLAKREIRKL